jgi:hypothetical protein
MNPSPDLHKKHLVQTLQSLELMKIISDPDPEQIEQRMVDLPNSKH